jgi:hypothetical protein
MLDFEQTEWNAPMPISKSLIMRGNDLVSDLDQNHLLALSDECPAVPEISEEDRATMIDGYDYSDVKNELVISPNFAHYATPNSFRFDSTWLKCVRTRAPYERLMASKVYANTRMDKNENAIRYEYDFLQLFLNYGDDAFSFIHALSPDVIAPAETLWSLPETDELTPFRLSVAIRNATTDSKIASSHSTLMAVFEDSLADLRISEIAFVIARFPNVLTHNSTIDIFSEMEGIFEDNIDEGRKHLGDEAFAWLIALMNNDYHFVTNLDKYDIPRWFEVLAEHQVSFDEGVQYLYDGCFNPEVVVGLLNNDIDDALFSQMRDVA